MTNENQMTFEAIDKHIDAINMADYGPSGRMNFTAADVTAAPANVLQKICGIYKGIRPILAVIANLPLIPEKWKAPIRVFIGLMDKLCP